MQAPTPLIFNGYSRQYEETRWSCNGSSATIKHVSIAVYAKLSVTSGLWIILVRENVPDVFENEKIVFLWNLVVEGLVRDKVQVVIKVVVTRSRMFTQVVRVVVIIVTKNWGHMEKKVLLMGPLI